MNNLIECKDIEYVLAIARHQSISAAANELFISQPALTKYLKSLERRLGVSLFNRSRKKLQPTEFGESYIAYALEMENITRNMAAELIRYHEKRTENLHVAFSSVKMRDAILKSLAILKKADAKLNADFSELTSDNIEKLLVEGKLDLGFTTLPTINPELQSIPLSEEYIFIVIPAEHPSCSQARHIISEDFPWIDLALFRSEQFVLRSPNTRFRAIVDRAFEQAGFVPDTLLNTRNNYTSLEFANIQRAICFIPQSFLPYILDSMNMKVFITGSPPIRLSAGAVYRKDAILSPPAQQLLRIMSRSQQ
ncbi:MAG: LysR family transcriptional regulator [Clostridia bacterium]|nr:LysR family transcriptional regulator [Clostridia bacterium]